MFGQLQVTKLKLEQTNAQDPGFIQVDFILLIFILITRFFSKDRKIPTTFGDIGFQIYRLPHGRC